MKDVQVKHVLKKWLGKKSPALQPRLTKEEVLAIAREAAAPYSERDHLRIAEVEESGGKLVWFVGTYLRGSTVEVLVDDLSGKAVEVKYLGSR